MFELLTNVVKELQCMKGINNYYESFFESRVSSTNPIPSGCPYTPEKPPSEESEKRFIDLTVDESCPFVANMNVVKQPDAKIVVSDDEESDCDSDSDSDESDDSDDSDSDESEYSEILEDNTAEIEEIEITDPHEMPNLHEMSDLHETHESHVPIEEVSIEVSERVDEIIQEVVPEVLQEEVSQEVMSEVIHEKVLDDVFEAISSQDTPGQGPEEPTKSQKRDVYLKMNITQLKTLAVSVGIRQDISKMKKKDLIQLLESLDE
jgi:hypothetical protein